MIKRILCTVLAIVLLAGTADLAVADCSGECNYEGECGINGTFNPSGRRYQDYYFNVEDPSMGSYKCWSAAKWTTDLCPPEPDCWCDPTNLTVTNQQSNASWSQSGDFAIYLSPDSLDPGASHTYADWAGTWAGQSTYIGTWYWTKKWDGYVDTYDLYQNEEIADLIGQSASDGTLVLSFVDVGSTVAATWAGYSSYNYPGPTIAIEGNCIPEPASMSLLTIGGLLTLFRRRRRQLR